jgi:hypothetical protein
VADSFGPERVCSDYGTKALEAGRYWHAIDDYEAKLHPDDRNNPIFNEEAESAGIESEPSGGV